MNDNLIRLKRQTREMGADNGKRTRAERVSGRMPLSHATSVYKFSSICEHDGLFSQTRLMEKGLYSCNNETHEQLLGTDKDVFFSLAPFCYPRTDCGVLFRRTLEEQFSGSSSATPFDSGGLLKVFTIENPDETPVSFFNCHRLPVPEHRELMEESLVFLFSEPDDYLAGNDPAKEGPVRITGGDSRRWTHEVRIGNDVSMNDGHLEAVFIVRDRAADQHIEDFLTWARKSKVPIIAFNAPRSGVFDEMKQQCINYIEDLIGE